MNLAIVLVLVSLFVQCSNAYQLPTVHRFGPPPVSSMFAIRHPRWLTHLPVNYSLHHSYSSWSRLFSIADKKDGKDLAFPSLDPDRNVTAFDSFFENKRHPAAASFVEDEMARIGLPEEIKNNQYDSERELHMDLEQFGLDDLPIILDHDGFPMWQEMTGKEHVGAVNKIITQFDKWKNGRLIKFDKKVIVFVNDSFNKPKNMLRRPDFAISGPDRLEDGMVRVVYGDAMNPHVIIQFSWTNDIDYKKCAVDDMMHFAGIEEYSHLGRPNVAYLIKALRRGTSLDAPVYGFDIYQVGQDQRTPDRPTMKYRVGGQEDTVIRITPVSMGLLDDEGEPFTIELSAIRERLERYNVTFDPALGKEM